MARSRMTTTQWNRLSITVPAKSILAILAKGSLPRNGGDKEHECYNVPTRKHMERFAGRVDTVLGWMMACSEQEYQHAVQNPTTNVLFLTMVRDVERKEM